jgi:glutathione peroxidase-family protein
MKAILINLLFLWCIMGQAQDKPTVIRLQLNVEYIPINTYEKQQPSQENVLLYSDEKKFGLVTSRDTLELHLQEKVMLTARTVGSVYLSQHYQRYYIMSTHTRDGFMIMIIPMKPFLTKKLYTIKLTSLQSWTN